ncbi:MAG: hypothetical protein IJR03_01825 [Bacteroidales bacterium]|nr:hypothetical protein [Bacteroidales bacterium]
MKNAMYNHLLNELASYSAKELDALWDELKDFNKIGPYASDFVEEIQEYNTNYNRAFKEADSNIGENSEVYISNDNFCLAA